MIKIALNIPAIQNRCMRGAEALGKLAGWATEPSKSP